MSDEVSMKNLEDVDLVALLKLVSQSLSNEGVTQKTVDFWRWKHFDNPFGQSVGLAACKSNELVAVRPLMRWHFLCDSGSYSALRAVDTATAPEWRGRGLFRKLTDKCVQNAHKDGVSFIFNSPNSSSLPGYVKMGWRHVAQLKVFLCVSSPARFVFSFMKYKFFKRNRVAEKWCRVSGGKVQSLSLFRDSRDLLKLASSFEEKRRAQGYRTPRTPEYLYWRYVDQPNADYGVHVSRDANGSISAISILRLEVRSGLLGAVLLEVFSQKSDVESVAVEIRRVKRELKVDYFVSYFSPLSVEASASKKCGFFRFPFKYINFAFRPLGENVSYDIDPLNPESWDISYGELEVF
ncbi:GNAT family N-acetyltransferase [Alloalcanivorax mobilis]|uniref:GNAT family N-acetyltransferase n=1 Tax=Alloalcanivorax mobilis TaxID=2019569 RepID=UPI0012FFF740|nr:GNAT family N-acetyltransferase [Alloalcanivorax mobilis]